MFSSIARCWVVVALLSCGCGEEDDPSPPPAVVAQPTPPSVTVSASSTPTGAHVTGGGRALGATPLTVQVPVPPPQPGQAQSFAFTFTMPGYTPVTLNATPVNNTISVNATLEPVRAPQQPVAPAIVAPPPSGELTEADARRMIVRYYAGRGEWAGQYVIANIERMRMDRADADQIEAHTRYRYRCILPACGGDQQDGIDQRVFYFQRRGSEWRIARMGDHMSARI